MDSVDKTTLEDAQNALNIKKIVLWKSAIDMAERSVNEHLKFEDAIAQTYSGCSKVQEVQGENQEEKEVFTYLFYFEAGIRLVEKGHDEVPDDSVTPLAAITATFVANYYSESKLSVGSVKAFAANNAGFNVWPFWREYVQSTCCRLGIDPIEVPLFRCKQANSNSTR